jgi:hypothetical protein
VGWNPENPRFSWLLRANDVHLKVLLNFSDLPVGYRGDFFLFELFLQLLCSFAACSLLLTHEAYLTSNPA